MKFLGTLFVTVHLLTSSGIDHHGGLVSAGAAGMT